MEVQCTVTQVAPNNYRRHQQNGHMRKTKSSEDADNWVSGKRWITGDL